MKIAILVMLLVTMMTSVSVFAGSTAVDLNPTGAFRSNATGVYGNHQVGYSDYRGTEPGIVSHAGIWSGTAASWVDLNPAGASESKATGIYGNHQVGNAVIGGKYYGGMWTGTAASWVNLTPAGANGSYVSAIFGDNQFGSVNGYAAMWSGSPSSWINLNPVGATGSDIRGAFGDVQVGYAQIGGRTHAGLWKGTAESFVDLTPDGDYSYAFGVYGNKQVGQTRQATLWSGTAESWVNLLPVKAAWSSAYAISHETQVGVVGGYRENGDVYNHASLWSGTASSWVDLHDLLPQGFADQSYALGIDASGTTTLIVGNAQNSASGQDRAILWQYEPVPEPSSFLVLGGGLLGLAGFIRRRA